MGPRSSSRRFDASWCIRSRSLAFRRLRSAVIRAFASASAASTSRFFSASPAPAGWGSAVGSVSLFSATSGSVCRRPPPRAAALGGGDFDRATRCFLLPRRRRLLRNRSVGERDDDGDRDRLTRRRGDRDLDRDLRMPRRPARPRPLRPPAGEPDLDRDLDRDRDRDREKDLDVDLVLDLYLDPAHPPWPVRHLAGEPDLDLDRDREEVRDLDLVLVIDCDLNLDRNLVDPDLALDLDLVLVLDRDRDLALLLLRRARPLVEPIADAGTSSASSAGVVGIAGAAEVAALSSPSRRPSRCCGCRRGATATAARGKAYRAS